MPIALGVIMLGLGLSLTLEDFKRVIVMPKPVFIGLLCQMLLLPVVCFAIATGFDLPPALAVGLMLLSASPGGATANLFSHLAKGDVALNITLTAVNSVLSLLTLPFIVNYSLMHFMGEGKVIPLQFDKVVQVFAIVLVPVGIGMFVRARKQGLADRLEKPVKILSAVFLLLVIAATVAKERAHVVEYFQQVGLAALAFNLVSMAVGYLVPVVVRLPKRQAIAIGMEIGIHNGTLAIAIASAPSLLNNTTMAVPPAVYSLIMFFTAAAFGYLVNRGTSRSA
ncbi:bile acid:Na+ symporter, BASS family [Nannocystis exedens]|uniref:Bile acid:Na+ symporter, BASS family n=1 Tax=Nannocystis exedens TaxID=54 RepID=A0A1I1V2A3_9BACT|nr:bile acid:sodium symporter family protein [Nannocystis exedens]PCC72290.1 bile acid:sodium symporter [Nannocystis exedens]SFD77054.1 bile acid:Na+ symporter, BASS family [Nannocystis exedens]